VNATYSGINGVTLTAYSDLLYLGVRSVLNTKTFGARVTGEHPLVGWTLLTFTGEFAKQKNYRDNPRAIDLDYYLGELGVKVKSASLLAGYEVLEGDNLTGFSTPLATLFAFNGWADVFLTTPVRGLNDFYVKGGYVFTGVPYLNKVTAQLAVSRLQAELRRGLAGA